MANADREQTEVLNRETQNVEKSLDFDSILQQEVGQFGWFQVRNLLLALIAVIFLAWSNNAYVFTTGRISTRCHIPECDLEEPEFSPDWLLNAIPGTSHTSFDNCQRFGNATAGPLEPGVCPAVWFNQSHLKSCERHLYQNTNTVVYDFNLACDEVRRTLIGSIRIFGTLFTQLFTGFISDRWGRRTALVFTAFNGAWLGVLKYFAYNYVGFIILEFIQAAIGGGTFQCAYILILEMVGPENRVLTGAIMNTGLSIGLVTLSLIAWAVPNWRVLSLVLFTPQLLTISYLWLMGESVRWYITKGRYEDCEKSLKNIARVNKRQLSEKSLEFLRRKTENEIQSRKDDTENKKKEKEPSLIKLLFKYKPVLFRCLTTPFMWITFTLIYQGLTINAVGISGNKYLNYMAVASSQIPGFWIANFLLDRLGRKPVLAGAYWICAACQIGYMFIPKNQYALSLAFYLTGSSCSGAMLSALYIFTAELYPTPYRHRFFAFSSMTGRFGSVFAPLTPALSVLVWEQFPFALFAGCACVSGALVLLAPETRGARLPDTMRQAADLGRTRTPRQPTTEFTRI
ncbi:solute carrier family 22 member 1-like isoform X1 [Ostrinia nubilalis]|uniref:solute carrier family 22 member 1-like isoform X1 n=1 Tax=Ostrinia nubilalis TaxID=29057 RepID=UPI0030825B51